jgi:hypothetical protein
MTAVKPAARQLPLRVGDHTCPGGDLHAAHSAEVDYADLLPRLFELKAENFMLRLPVSRTIDGY